MARSTISEYEAIESFRQAIEDAGLILHGPPIMDGRYHNVRIIDGSRSRSAKQGSYIGQLDPWPSGHIFNKKFQYLSRHWTAKAPTKSLSPEEYAKRAEEYRQQEAQRQRDEEARHREVAVIAKDIWCKSPVASLDHPYIKEKQIPAVSFRQATETIRRDDTLLCYKGDLLRAMQDIDGEIWNLQVIKPDKNKIYLKGGRTKGLFSLTGKVNPNGTLGIGEGAATMKSLW